MTKSAFSTRLSFNLSYYLNEKGMKQKHIADKVGIAPEHFSKIINGKVIPNFWTVYQIAEHLGITTADLTEFPPKGSVS